MPRPRGQFSSDSKPKGRHCEPRLLSTPPRRCPTGTRRSSPLQQVQSAPVTERSGAGPRLLILLAVLYTSTLGLSRPAQAGGGLKLEVTELARSVDRVRKERFLTVTVEISGA